MTEKEKEFIKAIKNAIKTEEYDDLLYDLKMDEWEIIEKLIEIIETK